MGEDRANDPDSSPATSYVSIPWNPEGTVGVAVGDGTRISEASSAEIRETALAYLARAGLNGAPMPLKGMGSAGEIILAIATGLAADVLVHIWKRVRDSFRTWRESKTERALNAHKIPCTIQLGDRRGSERDAVQLLLLVPGLEEELAAKHPNRNFWFVIFSATANIDFVQVVITDNDDLGRAVRQMAKIVRRMPSSRFINLMLQPGPFGSRRVTFNVA
jgi:hypothetical protein